MKAPSLPERLETPVQPLGAAHRLTGAELAGAVESLPGWSVREGALERRYRFADFDAAMAFAQQVAELARRLDHHPELRIEWGGCTVRWHTHSAGGITLNDLSCAARLDARAG
ncbi:MAG: 4a-hydroxytetrahydrobiopterin dehydratase [Rubrivivax sp.]